MTKRTWLQVFTAILFCIWTGAFVLDSIASDDWVTGTVLAITVIIGSALPVVGWHGEPDSLSSPKGLMIPIACWMGIMAIVTIGVRYDALIYLSLLLMYLPLWGAWKRNSFQAWRQGGKGGKCILVGILAALPVSIFYLWPLNGRYLNMQMVEFVPLAVGFSLLTAALPEEIFFRYFLQRRLTRVFNDFNGILLASLLFALYHYPFALWMADWPTYGKPLYALAYVLDQKMVLGILFGIVYFKTSSLLAAVTGHTLINACWLLSASLH